MGTVSAAKILEHEFQLHNIGDVKNFSMLR
jgi:hypothetical protein